MDVLDYAMQMELDGEKYYRDLAEKTNDQGIVVVLTRLADDEVRHYNAFKQLKENRTPEMVSAAVVDGAKTVFAEMAANARSFDIDVSQVELYEKAREVERKSRDFYLEKAEGLEDAAARSLVRRIAGEEELHYQLLSSIVDFVSRPVPGNWLENAEWYHHDEY